MMAKIWEGIWDNEYIFLSVAVSALVIVPILGLYLLSWTKTMLAAIQ